MKRAPDTAKELRNKSAIAFGMALIALLFVVETWVAHRSVPHPASPVVWSLLALVAGVGVMAGLWFRRRAAERG